MEINREEIEKTALQGRNAKIMTAIVAALVVGALVIFSGKGSDRGKPSDEGNPVWTTLLKESLADSSINQILLVKCLEGSLAEASYYIKNGDGRGWKLGAAGTAYIGRSGLGKTREGDGKTPEGDFTATSAFGILPDPGAPLGYITVTRTTVACDADCPYYNRIVDVSVTGKVPGEEMFTIFPQYNYGLTIDFNPENVYPLGSNIFIHCKGSKPYTAGCVALDETMMKEIVATACPGMKVCIHRK